MRAHVERAIERVKNYRILQSGVSIAMAPDLNRHLIAKSTITTVESAKITESTVKN